MDDEKNKRLMAECFISFEEITGLLLSKSYLDIIENPSRDGQMSFILIIQGYTWVVPFLIDDQNRIILKTAFPSRKFHKRYGGRK